MRWLSNFRFHPKLLDTLPGYGRNDLGADVGAGLTVACVALPLAMAFGIASGVKPEQGLITAIVAGFLISVLGGSRVQIGGPAGAFVALLYTIGERYGLGNLLLATMMAGVVLFAMGLFKLGQLVRFVPVAIVLGFTNGIAVIIAISQIRDFFGLPIDHLPANFFSQMAVIGTHLDNIDPATAGVSIASLALLFLWPRPVPRMTTQARKARDEAMSQAARSDADDLPTLVSLGASADATGKAIARSLAADATTTAGARPAPGSAEPGSDAPDAPRPAAPTGVWAAIRRRLASVPAPLAALVLVTFAVWISGLQIETIGSRFGGIPATLPTPTMPTFDWASAQNLVGPILAIAFLGAIESLLCARIADGMTHERHDPNQELMAQGVANFVVPFFGGVAATGTIARTVTNVRAGARTPVAGIVHSVTLLVFMLALAPLAASIPMAVLAAILVQVAWNMGDWRAFATLGRFPSSYRLTLVVTFLLTVVFDLTIAVQVGLVMSCLFFILRMASLTRIESLPVPADLTAQAGDRPTTAWQIYGTLFFGSVSKLDQLLPAGQPQPGVLVLNLHQLVKLDPTGLDELQTLHRELVDAGGRLIIAEANAQPRKLIVRSGFLEQLGRENVFNRIDDVWAALRAEARPANAGQAGQTGQA